MLEIHEKLMDNMGSTNISIFNSYSNRILWCS